MKLETSRFMKIRQHSSSREIEAESIEESFNKDVIFGG